MDYETKRLLPHWVLHGLAADEVEVHVHNFLVAVFARVHNQAVTGLGDTFLSGQITHDGEHVPGNGFVFIGEGVVVGDVLLWDDEDVSGGYRVDISEGGDHFVLMYYVAGDLPSHNLAEDAVRISCHGCTLLYYLSDIKYILTYITY